MPFPEQPQLTPDTRIELTKRLSPNEMDRILNHSGISWGVKGFIAYMNEEPDPMNISDTMRWGDGSGHEQTTYDVVRDSLSHGFVKIAE